MLPAADHRKTPLPRTVGDLSGDRKVGVKTRKPDKFLHFPPTGDLESGPAGAAGHGVRLSGVDGRFRPQGLLDYAAGGGDRLRPQARRLRAAD
jgi:hypothetical protein